MCMLPLNIVNEKIYLVLWVWYIILCVLSGLAVVYRLVCILCPDIRTWMIWKPQRQWVNIGRFCRNKPVRTLKSVRFNLNLIKYGDWFLLRQMTKNVDEETFDEFLELLYKDGNLAEDYETKKPIRADWLKSRLPRTPTLYSDSGVSDPSLHTEETDFTVDNTTMERK